MVELHLRLIKERVRLELASVVVAVVGGGGGMFVDLCDCEGGGGGCFRAE